MVVVDVVPVVVVFVVSVGVAKIHIGSGDVYKNFIEVNENEQADAAAEITEDDSNKGEHRKISGTMTPTIVEVYGRD